MSDTINPQDGFGLLRSYSRHRDFVRLALGRIAHEIEERALVHDASKMMDDEFAGFTRINAAARVHKFGSPEYADGMKRAPTGGSSNLFAPLLEIPDELVAYLEQLAPAAPAAWGAA